MKFLWTEEYSIGLKEIDEQHQHFFEMANAVYELMEQENIDRTKLESAVNDMANYALYHLSFEEEMFARYEYSEKDKHMREHEIYRVAVRNLFDQSRDATSENLSALTARVVDFATTWLSTHILSADKKMGLFLAEEMKLALKA